MSRRQPVITHSSLSRDPAITQSSRSRAANSWSSLIHHSAASRSSLSHHSVAIRSSLSHHSAALRTAGDHSDITQPRCQQPGITHHVCSANPAAAEGRVTKWLQRAGAPSSPYQFCLLHGLRDVDWLPSLLSKNGRDAAKRDRSLRAGDDARCGTKYVLAVLLMWSHGLHKRRQKAPSASSRVCGGKWKAACFVGSSRWLNGRRGCAPLAEIRHRRRLADAKLNRSRRNPSGSLSALKAEPTPRTCWR